MTVETAGTSVRTSIVVEAPIAHAFHVFTDGINTWWNHDHHLIADFDHMVVEPRVGGHIVDYSKDGSESRWARVLAYEPPHLFVFSWDISLRWEIETDPARTSEVAVSFTPQGADRTLVELEHRHLDRHGEGWESMRDAVGSPDGWNLEGYGAAVHRNA